jgi:hypothetical protein
LNRKNHLREILTQENNNESINCGNMQIFKKEKTIYIILEKRKGLLWSMLVLRKVDDDDETVSSIEYDKLSDEESLFDD